MAEERRYTINLLPQPEGGFTVLVPALPEVVTEGDTREEALANAKEAIEGVLAMYREEGWQIPADVEPQLEALEADVGTGGVPVYLPPGGIADAPNARLKGRPVIVTEYNKTLGTVGDIVAPFVYRNDLQNVQPLTAKTYDYYGTYPYRPQQWWL